MKWQVKKCNVALCAQKCASLQCKWENIVTNSFVSGCMLICFCLFFTETILSANSTSNYFYQKYEKLCNVSTCKFFYSGSRLFALFNVSIIMCVLLGYILSAVLFFPLLSLSMYRSPQCPDFVQKKKFYLNKFDLNTISEISMSNLAVGVVYVCTLHSISLVCFPFLLYLHWCTHTHILSQSNVAFDYLFAPCVEIALLCLTLLVETVSITQFDYVCLLANLLAVMQPVLLGLLQSSCPLCWSFCVRLPKSNRFPFFANICCPYQWM